ncbi:hypothetical protein RhiirA4_475997, partial [Rhizophagus irregularis]
MNNTNNILHRLRNTVTNISSSFNKKFNKKISKNQKNIQNDKNQKNHINNNNNNNNNIPVLPVDTLHNIDVLDTPVMTEQQSRDNFINYSDIIIDYKQLVFATHNIQGGFQKKKDHIIRMMLDEHIDFLHVCETNERDNNFDISKSVAHIKYTTPSHHEFCDFNINNLYMIKPSLQNKNLDYLKKCILDNSQDKNILKLILEYFDMVHIGEKFNHKISPTYYSADTNKIPSTIDYIFGSQNLCNKTTEFKILDSTEWYTSDHRIISISIDHPNTNLVKNKKFFNISRDSSNHEDQYNTKDMDSDQWNIFQREINKCEYVSYEEYLSDFSTNDSSFQTFVNNRMNQIQHDIKTALDTANVKKYKRGTPKRNNLPLHIRRQFNQLYQLASLKRYLKDKIAILQNKMEFINANNVLNHENNNIELNEILE